MCVWRAAGDRRYPQSCRWRQSATSGVSDIKGSTMSSYADHCGCSFVQLDAFLSASSYFSPFLLLFSFFSTPLPSYSSSLLLSSSCSSCLPFLILYIPPSPLRPHLHVAPPLIPHPPSWSYPHSFVFLFTPKVL